MSTRRASLRIGTLLGLAALLAAGCAIPADLISGVIGGRHDNGNNAATQITITVVNTTDVTLDPEIYISAEPVSADELFQPANKYEAFGVGTLGILADVDSDTFTLDCAQARVIGTQGGKFGDDLHNPEGAGQPIVLTQDLSVFCGGSVTFTYSRTADGFTTSYAVER
jgi:hypothetical protein